MEKKIAVLILFFNRLEETVKCIDSFLPSKQPVYVLNNGSEENLWDRLKEKYTGITQVKLFHSDTNLGVSIGRNFLIEKAEEEWVLIVDNDTFIKEKEQWLHRFYSIINSDTSIEIVTLHIYNVHESSFVKPIKVIKTGKKVSIETTDEMVTNCFPGTGSIIKREVFVRHGLFDVSLFVGFEDYEYALRCMNSAEGPLKVYHTNQIDLIHDHKFQKSSADKNAVKIRYDEQRIKDSYNSIVAKYNIEFEHDWQWWTRKQMKEMTELAWVSKAKSIINRIRGK